MSKKEFYEGKLPSTRAKKPDTKKKKRKKVLEQVKDWNKADPKERFSEGVYPILPDDPKGAKARYTSKWGYRKVKLAPITEMEYQYIYMMSMKGLPYKDMAAILGFSQDVWTKLVKEDERLAAHIDRGRSAGNMAIMQTFYDMATDKKNANVTMAAVKSRVGIKDRDDKPAVEVNIGSKPDMANVTPDGKPEGLGLITINVVNPVQDEDEGVIDV